MILKPKELRQHFLNVLLFGFFFTVVSLQLSAEKSETGNPEVLLNETKTDREKIDLLLQISETYAHSSFSKSFYYANEAFVLALKVRDKTQAARAGNQLGSFYFNAGILDSAAYYFEKSLKNISPDIDDYSLAVGYNHLGAVYLANENLEDAFINYRKALEAMDRFKKINDTLPLPGVSEIYNNLGLTYKEKKDYPNAILNFEKGIVVVEKTLGEQRIHARLLNNYGSVLMLSGQNERALKALEESLEIRLELEDIIGIIASYQNLGFYYGRQNDNQNATTYATKAYLLASKFNVISDVYENAGFLQSLYNEMGMADSASKYLEISKTFQQQIYSSEADEELEKQQLLQELKLIRQNLNKQQTTTKRQLTEGILIVIFSLALVATFILNLRKQLLKPRSGKIIFTEKAFCQQNHK